MPLSDMFLGSGSAVMDPAAQIAASIERARMEEEERKKKELLRKIEEASSYTPGSSGLAEQAERSRQAAEERNSRMLNAYDQRIANATQESGPRPNMDAAMQLQGRLTATGQQYPTGGQGATVGPEVARQQEMEEYWQSHPMGEDGRAPFNERMSITQFQPDQNKPRWGDEGKMGLPSLVHNRPQEPRGEIGDEQARKKIAMFGKRMEVRMLAKRLGRGVPKDLANEDEQGLDFMLGNLNAESQIKRETFIKNKMEKREQEAMAQQKRRATGMFLQNINPKDRAEFLSKMMQNNVAGEMMEKKFGHERALQKEDHANRTETARIAAGTRDPQREYAEIRLKNAKKEPVVNRAIAMFDKDNVNQSVNKIISVAESEKYSPKETVDLMNSVLNHPNIGINPVDFFNEYAKKIIERGTAATDSQRELLKAANIDIDALMRESNARNREIQQKIRDQNKPKIRHPSTPGWKPKPGQYGPGLLIPSEWS